jgi:uncharacterized protein YbjT (DUF2867 family)
MKIAVATPTGNVGSKVSPRLLDARSELTLLVRNPEKVAGLTARGARAETGDLQDAGYVLRATQGAESLYWATPPNFAAPDILAFQRALGKNAADAVRKNRMTRVVHLSSIGAQMQSGTGPIVGLHQVENLLDETGASVTHLRAAYFMENYLFALDSIRNQGAIFLPVRGDRRLCMVATEDIAQVAARCLLDTTGKGRRVLGVQGPVDLSFDQAAGILSEVLGKTIRHVRVEPEQARQAFLGMGASPDVAEKYLEMYRAIDAGTLEIAERRPESTTPTTFAEFARRVMKPLI